MRYKNTPSRAYFEIHGFGDREKGDIPLNQKRADAKFWDFWNKSRISEEKGAAMVISLMVLVILSLLGSAAIITTTTQVQIAANQKQSKIAFYAAESGWQRTAQWLDRQVSIITTDMTDQEIAEDLICGNDPECVSTETSVPVSSDDDINFSAKITYNGWGNAPGYSTDFKRFNYKIESTGRGHNNASSRVTVNVEKVFYNGGY